jgi:hypothetical protein
MEQCWGCRDPPGGGYKSASSIFQRSLRSPSDRSFPGPLGRCGEAAVPRVTLAVSCPSSFPHLLHGGRKSCRMTVVHSEPPVWVRTLLQLTNTHWDQLRQERVFPMDPLVLCTQRQLSLSEALELQASVVQRSFCPSSTPPPSSPFPLWKALFHPAHMVGNMAAHSLQFTCQGSSPQKSYRCFSVSSPGSQERADPQYPVRPTSGPIAWSLEARSGLYYLEKRKFPETGASSPSRVLGTGHM